MSSIIPPLLSSSPPPMVSTILLDEDDDEFGNFTMASDLCCDTDVLSPTDINTQVNGIDDELDRRKNETKNQDCSTKYNSFQYFPEIPPDITTETCDLASPEEDDKNVSEILDNETINYPIQEDINTINVDNETINYPIIEDINTINVDNVPEPDLDDGFADFHTFTEPEVHEILKNTSDSPTSFNHTNFENLELDNQDDEFGDFNDYSLQSTTVADQPLEISEIVNLMFPACESITEEYIDNDFTSVDSLFVQLKDITDTSALMYQWSKSNSQNFLLQALNIDTRNILYGLRWNESMPRYAATLGFAPLEPVKTDVANVEVSQELLQQTDIPSAEFDWVGSGLTNPLEITPTKIIENQQSNNEESEHTTEKIKQTQLQSSDDNDSLNSLKLSDKRDNDFEDFHCFQSSKIEELSFDNWPVSLRETHISNVKVDEPGWLKPTILTPDLPRKKLECEEDIVFDTKISSNQESDVQINEALPPLKPELSRFNILEPEQSLPCKLEPSSNNTQTFYETPLESPIPVTQETIKIEDDDEFTEFQSTTFAPIEPAPTIPEPLQPSILQPIKVENTPNLTASTTINWPAPGITDEDLQWFNLYKPSTGENVTKDVDNLLKPIINEAVHNDKTGDDDDWSDFISNQTTQLSNLQINKPIQNGFQTSLVSNQYVVLASKPDEIEDEWSDFVSSQPPPAPETVNNRLPRSSIPKLNLDWNGPPQFSSWSASITPNIITNPVSFESFQGFAAFDTDLLKNRIGNKKTPNIIVQPKKSTVPSISSIPDLEFIAPKNRTWKK